MVVVQPRLRPDDLERLLDNGEIDPETSLELVDGEIVWLTCPKGIDHARIVVIIARLVGPFVDAIGAWLFSESVGYLVGTDNMNLRIPDMSILTKERFDIFAEGRAWGIGAPDLAVEVLSPEQYGEPYARQKVPEYLGSGAKVVWLVNPENRTVRIYEAGRADFSVYSGDAEITLDQIAPGFRVPISSFFPE